MTIDELHYLYLVIVAFAIFTIVLAGAVRYSNKA